MFYGFSAITKVLLQDVQLKCENESVLNCISTNGNAVLARFGFDTINIYENLAVGSIKKNILRLTSSKENISKE